jgi:hypothetical protein
MANLQEILRPWSSKNPVPYRLHANNKNIGRGEYKVVWELVRKLGYKMAKRNPNLSGNPDIVIIGALGMEVKEPSSSGSRFRMSAGEDMLSIVDSEIYRPNEKFVRKHFSQKEFTDFRRDSITAVNLRKIPRLDNRSIVRKVFAAYGISHLIVVTPDGFALLDQKSFTKNFILYRISRGAMEFALRTEK